MTSGAVLPGVDFRSKYVDHPDRHQLHDWITCGYRGKDYVIYFIGKGALIPWEGAFSPDPSSPDFRPPVNCGDDFYVSPDVDRTYDALKEVVIASLGLR